MGVRAGHVPVARRPASGLARAYLRQELWLNRTEHERRKPNHSEPRYGINPDCHAKASEQQRDASETQRVSTAIHQLRDSSDHLIESRRMDQTMPLRQTGLPSGVGTESWARGHARLVISRST